MGKYLIMFILFYIVLMLGFFIGCLMNNSSKYEELNEAFNDGYLKGIKDKEEENLYSYDEAEL